MVTPSPTPPWSMLFSREQEGGGGGEGEGEVPWVNRALEGSILKVDIQGAFYLTFLSKIAAVPRAKLLGVGSKLYPSNIQRMLNYYLNRFKFKQSLSRVCQNRASERKDLQA